ncbi:alpha/beta hydrolase [Tepidibacter hydrothermalis]|uniref:Alpha/beta hydrolase n=1 Tax=Tepidibacter hydrothermalis TaxID=3036126 RepID=A0ABY8E8V3_9FIRM|nr:alpha/beta hydrolase [Tepidibacter hydrothermalis]WFD09335.1 alpha/beta hydrolase [Tepidibacter hydrothermalis]
MVEEFKVKSDDGVSITVHKWADVEKSRGCILILHGMAEHSLKYDEFSRLLNKNGYIVYGCDHRGHGKTGIEHNQLGHFDENGWDKIVSDIKNIIDYIKKENNKPLILLGHSMGSLLARTCIQEFPEEFSAVILSGTTIGGNFVKRNIGYMISKIYASIYGYNKKAYLMDKLTFGNYNKSFYPNNTEFDWLSSDEDKVDEYTKDSLCGFVCSGGLYVNLLKGVKLTINRDNINKIPKKMPVLIFSGDKDMVGSNSKDVVKLYNAYKRAGIENIDLKIYENGRHEMLNELNRYEVYEYIIRWIGNI